MNKLLFVVAFWSNLIFSKNLILQQTVEYKKNEPSHQEHLLGDEVVDVYLEFFIKEKGVLESVFKKIFANESNNLDIYFNLSNAILPFYNSKKELIECRQWTRYTKDKFLLLDTDSNHSPGGFKGLQFNLYCIEEGKNYDTYYVNVEILKQECLEGEYYYKIRFSFKEDIMEEGTIYSRVRYLGMYELDWIIDDVN